MINSHSQPVRVECSETAYHYCTLFNLDPRALYKMQRGKRPWHRLLTSAISLVYNLTQLIYPKPYNCMYICVEKKLRVKINALLRHCITCFFSKHFDLSVILEKIAYTVIALIYSKTTFRGFESQPVPGPFPSL